MDLGKPNFLDQIPTRRQGESGGYLLLVDPQSRLIVTATDPRRILEALPAPGVNPAIDRYIGGEEGTGILVSPAGVEVLVAVKRVPSANWYVALVLPTAEAFAPISAMQQRTLIAAILLTLLAGGLIWWMLRRQLAPMLAAVKTLAMLSATNLPHQPLPIDRQDEIGDLIGAFNHLIETLRQREEALAKTHEELSRNSEFLSRTNAMARVGGWEIDLFSDKLYWTQETYRIREITRRQSSRKAPAPYITSKLQQDASTRLGMAPKRAMSGSPAEAPRCHRGLPYTWYALRSGAAVHYGERAAHLGSHPRFCAHRKRQGDEAARLVPRHHRA